MAEGVNTIRALAEREVARLRAIGWADADFADALKKVLTLPEVPEDTGRGRKYCRGCTRRLVESDGAYWRRDFRCLSCALVLAFAAHGHVYMAALKVPQVVRRSQSNCW